MIEVLILVAAVLSALWVGTRHGLKTGAHRGMCFTVAAISVFYGEERQDEYQKLVTDIARTMVTQKKEVTDRADFIIDLLPMP